MVPVRKDRGPHLPKAWLYRLTTGGANLDGGIDLLIEKNVIKKAVQCKQWRTWNVGVKAVREFLGALTDAKIEKGIFITLRGYTDSDLADRLCRVRLQRLPAPIHYEPGFAGLDYQSPVTRRRQRAIRRNKCNLGNTAVFQVESVRPKAFLERVGGHPLGLADIEPLRKGTGS